MKVLPESVVLLCIFHVLKFHRSLVSTALARQEVKHEIFKYFKKVLHSRTEDKFIENNEAYLNIVGNVEIRTSNKEYVKLSDYYKKNWESCKHMWVKCYRSHLPLLGDNTSNRVEGQFGTLKKSIEDSFVSIPNTLVGIKHVVQYGDERLLERYVLTNMKRLQIFHPIERIRLLNATASKQLNTRGCKLFNEALDKEHNQRSKFIIIQGGVKEEYRPGNFKTFETTSSLCQCEFYVAHQAPCHHILFLRRLDEIADESNVVFKKELFHPRYFRKDLRDVLDADTPTEELDIDDVNSNSVVVEDDEVNCTQIQPLSDRSKFKKIMPVAMRIANLAAMHDTNTFLTYLDDLQSIELKIRRGRRIFSVKDKQISNKDISQIRDLDENTTLENEHLVNTNKHIDEIQHNDGDNIDQDSMNSDNRSSKYAGLVFKECVRTKGRPRSKRTKQVTFNKTALDRQPKAKKIKTKVPEIENSSSESEGVDDIIYDDSDDDVSDRDESQD